ncbi:MAG: PCC domain-containing protein [Kiloniellaceae bacterium]
MRTLVQPGDPLQPRRLLEWAAPATDLRVQLAGGQDLLRGIVAALAARGIAHAAVQVVAAEIARMAYLTGAEDPSGQRVATYGAPTWLEGPVTLLGANGILGPGPDGDTLLHCHAVVVDAAGRLHGGHLPPGDVLLGDGGAVALATPLREAAFAACYDSETNYPLFQPQRISA